MEYEMYYTLYHRSTTNVKLKDKMAYMINIRIYEMTSIYRAMIDQPYTHSSISDIYYSYHNVKYEMHSSLYHMSTITLT